jgi:hypothetical protein
MTPTMCYCSGYEVRVRLEKKLLADVSRMHDIIVQNVTKTRQHEKNGVTFVQYLLIYKIPIPRAEHLG